MSVAQIISEGVGEIHKIGNERGTGADGHPGLQEVGLDPATRPPLPTNFSAERREWPLPRAGAGSRR